MPFRVLLLFGLLVVVRSGVAQPAQDPFAWDTATIYHVVTDRFANGDADNDGAYGRGLDGNGTPYDPDSAGHFHGGDFRGITAWIEDGYFRSLGVNTLRISAPYEQVHGWIGDGSVQRYGFDGRMPLDFTVPDRAFGSADDFRALVTTAHEAGLKVIMDVRLSGPGQPTLHDMVEFGFGSTGSDRWRSWRPSDDDRGWGAAEELFLEVEDSDSTWAAWWGPAWVNAELPGYESCRADPCPPGDIAFRTDASLPAPDVPAPGGVDTSATAADSESDAAASGFFPPFLIRKWGPDRTAEQTAELDAFFSRTGYPRSAAYVVVKWISDWIRTFGVDGIVVTDAPFVDDAVLAAMKREGEAALAAFRRSQDAGAATAEGGDLRAPFWLVADARDVANPAVFVGRVADARIDAAWLAPLESATAAELHATYAKTATEMADRPDFRKIGTLPEDPSTDTEVEDAVRLMLRPGPVSILYGRESGRLREAGGSSGGRLTPMNWVTADDTLRSRWERIGTFRAGHPAVGRGGHEVVSDEPVAFFRGVRIGQTVDRIVVVLGADGRTRLNVARIWPDDTALRDARTGNIALVSFGQVTMTADERGILLIEEIPE